MKKKIIAMVFCIMLVLALPTYASAATKKVEETKQKVSAHVQQCTHNILMVWGM